MTKEEIVNELRHGAVLVHFVEKDNEPNKYQLQMGDEHYDLHRDTFFGIMKKGHLEYAGSESENDLIYILKQPKK